MGRETPDERLKRYAPRVAAIAAAEPALAALSDEALKAKTAEFRAMLAPSGIAPPAVPSRTADLIPFPGGDRKT